MSAGRRGTHAVATFLLACSLIGFALIAGCADDAAPLDGGSADTSGGADVDPELESDARAADADQDTHTESPDGTDDDGATDALPIGTDSESPVDVMPPDTGGTESCDEEVEAFRASVWPVLDANCFICHGNTGIGALGSELRLIEVDAPADDETNYRTLRYIAGKERDGVSILRRKPLGELTHGGGDVLLATDEAYGALAAFVDRVEAGEECEGSTEPDPDVSDVLATLEWSVDDVSVRVGRVVPISVVGRNADGDVLGLNSDLVVEAADAAVAVVDGTTRVRGVSAGSTSVVARVGDVESGPLAVTVAENPDFGTSQIRVSPAQVVLALDESRSMRAQVRERTGARVDEARVHWASSDELVVEVDEDGVATGVGAGVAQIWADFEGASSDFVTVQVSADDTYMDIRWASPVGDAVTWGELDVRADLRARITGFDAGVGTPLIAGDAVLVVDGETELAMQADIFGLNVTVDTTAWPEGEHRIQVRATVGEVTVVSSEQVVVRRTTPEAGSWVELGGMLPPTWNTIYGTEALLFELAGELNLVTNRCGRECSIGLYVFNLGNLAGNWAARNYAQRNYTLVEGVVTERVQQLNRIDLGRYVGWGWPSTTVRQAHAMPATATRMVTWSNQDSRTSFNSEDEPVSYWNDCHVAQWDSGAGYDGAGGWRLLSTEAPDWQDDVPDPAVMVGEAGDQHHPAGADAVRAEDCSWPHVGLLAGDPVVAFVSTPIPANDWRLRLRRWTGAAWSDVTAPMVVPPFARLHDMIVDSSGGTVVAVDAADRNGEVRRFAAGAWRSMNLEQNVAALRALSGGDLFALAIDDGDLSLHRYSGGAWTQVGSRLNRGTWSEVHEADLFVASDGTPVVAWSEGPASGQRDAWVALWDAAAGEWQPVGAGPIDVAPDAHAEDVRAIVDSQGHVVVTLAEPNTRDSDLQGGSRNWLRRIRRSTDPVAGPVGDTGP